nr:SpoIIE family protein phosphatase [uncultured Actinotalea sp.]
MTPPADDGGETPRLEALHALGAIEAPREERFDRVVRLARQLFGVSTAFVSLVDRDRLVYKAEVGLDLAEAPRAGSFCTVVVDEGRALAVPDAREDDRFSASSWVRDDPGIRFYAGHPLVSAGGHRVGTLCVADHAPRAFSDADARLLRDLALWVQQELVVEDELRRAGSVQAGLLPGGDLAVPGFERAGACLPAREVGGDLYDWRRTRDGAVVVTLADVMGKGMAAAIIAATVRAVLRADRGVEPEVALTAAEEALDGDLASAGAFVTGLHAVLDPTTAVLRYADAGHGLSAVRRADGSLERLRPTGPPLGMAFGAERSAADVRLAPGDLVVSVSDGVLDLVDSPAPSPADVAALVAEARSAQEVVDRFARLARAHPDRPDDVTVVALRRESR